MFHIGGENMTLKPGFNFYPLSDRSSFGFRALFGARVYWVRYSKIRHRWFLEVTP
jgi:hypothetical protein